jgi:hypothetical protein
MLKSPKSQLTCSYCSKIIKDPIDLPCDDSICREHLSERDVVKANKIKCKKCNDEFEVKGNDFKSNDELVKLLESRLHFSKVELNLKNYLENSIRLFFNFYDKFIQNRTKLDLDVFDHFQEIRFQIDEHREELKKRIDEIALEMIDETKKSQEKYLKELKERFSSFDETKSIEYELNQIEKSFRHPNLLIPTIREMQQKQEESLDEILFKLNEMSKMKDQLKTTNEFKPNLSSFTKEEETTLFGFIKLDGYWLDF